MGPMVIVRSKNKGVRSNYELADECDNYDTALAKLWGGATLYQLRAFINKGIIEDPNIHMMASRMDVQRTYNQNCHKMDVSVTFELMMKEWFQEKLFSLRPSDAKAELIRVLKNSQCCQRVVYTIEKLAGENE